MKPVVHGLEAEYGDRIDFVYLDVDVKDEATTTLKEQLDFKKTPHIVMIDGEGNVVETLGGSAGESDFVNAFDGLIAGSAF